MLVAGFRSKHAALAFEAAWQKPHANRHVKRVWNALGQPRCSLRTSVRVRLLALSLLLRHGAWATEELRVCRVDPMCPPVPKPP